MSQTGGSKSSDREFGLVVDEDVEIDRELGCNELLTDTIGLFSKETHSVDTTAAAGELDAVALPTGGPWYYMYEVMVME